MQKSKDFLLKQNNLINSRLLICRQWLIVALSFYIFKASFVIYPMLVRKFNKEELLDEYEDG